MSLEKLALKLYCFLFYRKTFARKKVIVYGFFSIKNQEKLVILGKLKINDFVYINAKGGVVIGDNVSLSAGSKIISTGLKITRKGLSHEHIDEKIVIGDNVQVGAGAIVLSGVKIPSNVIIGAQSVVTKSIEIPGVYVGAPAKLIRKFDVF
ncbi:acyltransferase [Halomonas denitrificans]|uniref:acyltransferase n=1 Tax=Halomonas denitrificans TaxID=370769 RepID=UPI001CD7DCEC|nr:acyltransferase [Halomonas denitrificans]MCA0976439.1 acyltransferase [Halomonas denitrificans]